MPHFESNDGHRIHYRVHGVGKPVVLVHGWMVGGAVWDPVVDTLASAGMQLYIPDQRGAGESAKPESGYGLEQYAADIASLVRAAGLERISLIGHSMGGQIAQVAAAELGAAVDKLLLVCSVPAGGMPLPPEAAALFRNSAGNPEAQSAILGMACKTLDDAGLQTILSTAATVAPQCVEQSFDAWTTGGFADRLGRIQAKTIVYGTDDPFLTPETLDATVVKLIPGAVFVHQSGPGHYPQVETPRETGPKLAGLMQD